MKIIKQLIKHVYLIFEYSPELLIFYFLLFITYFNIFAYIAIAKIIILLLFIILLFIITIFNVFIISRLGMWIVVIYRR